MLSFDCLRNNTGVPLVNQKVRTLIENFAPNEVQFIDTEIFCTDGILTNTYFFMNILNSIKGIDREKSIYTTMDDSDDILFFKYSVYKKNVLNSYNIARDIEYSTNIISQ